MEFSLMQKQIVANANAYCERYNVIATDEFVALKMYEEVGEFAQALLIHKKMSRPEKFLPDTESRENVAQELSDIVGMAIFTAYILNIDLEKALEKKWLQKS